LYIKAVCGIIRLDIVLSKLCRNLEKDFSDIDALMRNADLDSIQKLIIEVNNDIHTRYPRIRDNFAASLATFKSRYRLAF
jgi:hypothetical protein